MSTVEYHEGTLVEVSKDVEGFLNKVQLENIDSKFVDYFDEDDFWLDRDSGYVYLRSMDKLFKIEGHRQEYDSFSHFVSTKSKDGNLFFSTSFYNGGACLEEILTEYLSEEIN